MKSKKASKTNTTRLIFFTIALLLKLIACMNIAYAVYCRRVFRFYQLFFLLLFLHSYAVDGDKMNNIQSHHTWNRVYFNGSWWDVDTTNDVT